MAWQEEALNAKSALKVADLKHRLERAEEIKSLLCEYGKETEHNIRLSLPHKIFAAIDKACAK